jgi:hypothetical protein
MKRNQCSKHYPKLFNIETVVDMNGFAVYKQSKNDRFVMTLFSTSDVSRGPPPDLAAIVSLKFTFAVTINMSAFSITNRVFSILTNHGRQASIPCATQNLSQQQMLTQDSILDVITTQESPATSFAKLSTSTKQESVVRYFLILTTIILYQLIYTYMNSSTVFWQPRRRLTYSETLQDTNVSMLFSYI